MSNVAPEFIELYEENADCPNCPLARTRTRTVPGTGHAAADFMFIGEAPGAREDEQGVPFVGPAGRFLDELLAAAGLSRDTVYICNVVKCRPPANRDPAPDEIDACHSYLDRQIEIVDPKVLVTLGRFSMARWFPGTTISRVHGQPKRIDGRFVVPMYHPAAALHRGDLRPVIEADFAQLPGLLTEAPAEPQEASSRQPGTPASAGPAPAPVATVPQDAPQERLL